MRMSKLKKCLYLINLLERKGSMTLKEINESYQYSSLYEGEDDSLYDYLLSAYHIEGMSELALKHRNKIILTDAPTGVENVQMILEAIDQKRGIECDYYSYKNNTLKEHLLIPYFLRTWENRWYLNSYYGTERNWRSWNRKVFGRR